jgi:hypothetical protein
MLPQLPFYFGQLDGDLLIPRNDMRAADQKPLLYFSGQSPCAPPHRFEASGEIAFARSWQFSAGKVQRKRTVSRGPPFPGRGSLFGTAPSDSLEIAHGRVDSHLKQLDCARGPLRSRRTRGKQLEQVPPTREPPFAATGEPADTRDSF